MDEALKARLIGAAVLVAVAVLLIPELLSGRKPVEAVGADGEAQRGTRTVIIDLTGGGAPPAEPVEARASAVPPASGEPAPGGTPGVAPTYEAAARAPEPERTTAGSEPAPAAPGSAAPVVSAPAASAPEIVSPAPPPPTAVPRAAQGGWAVQVGAFGSAATANGLVRKLAADGYHAFVAPVQRGGKTLHRVRVGPQPDKAGAERTAGQLKAKGLPATVVQND